MGMAFDPYREWLKIPDGRRPPTDRDLLGLPPGETDAARIREAALKRYTDVRQYALGPRAEEANRLLAELGQATACLLGFAKGKTADPEALEEMIQQWVAAGKDDRRLEPLDLVEPMTIREALEDMCRRLQDRAEHGDAQSPPDDRMKSPVARGSHRSGGWRPVLVAIGGATLGCLAISLAVDGTLGLCLRAVAAYAIVGPFALRLACRNVLPTPPGLLTSVRITFHLTLNLVLLAGSSWAFACLPRGERFSGADWLFIRAYLLIFPAFLLWCLVKLHLNSMKRIDANAGQAWMMFIKHHLLSIAATALALGLTNVLLRLLLTWLPLPTISAA
jgi:hypothetical protein